MVLGSLGAFSFRDKLCWMKYKAFSPCAINRQGGQGALDRTFRVKARE